MSLLLSVIHSTAYRLFLSYWAVCCPTTPFQWEHCVRRSPQHPISIKCVHVSTILVVRHTNRLLMHPGTPEKAVCQFHSHGKLELLRYLSQLPEAESTREHFPPSERDTSRWWSLNVQMVVYRREYLDEAALTCVLNTLNHTLKSRVMVV